MTRASHSQHDIANLSLREKIAQLVFVRIGSNLPPVRRVEADEDRVAALLEQLPVGGLLLFNGGPKSKATIDRLQSASKIPLLVAADIERGVGQQVAGYTLFPHQMAFEQLGPRAADVVGDYVRALAQEAREAGIHITFGPVADVNTNPNNPIIATRAYSESMARAAELSAAYVRAGEAAGLFTTAKHFPGHGDTHGDSHDSMPSLPLTRERMQQIELPPFQAAIDAGCSLVMTSHVAYPNIDPSGQPATLSTVLLQQLLRREMGFKGAICSDSLLMAGVRDRFEREEEMALATLQAGVDLLLDLEEPTKVVDFLCECVAHGTLAETRVDEALARLWELKERAFGAAEHDDSVPHSHSRKAIGELAERVARDAIQIVARSDRSALPFNATKPLAAVLLKPFETAIDPPEQPLAAALRERFRDVQYAQLGPKADAAAYETAKRLVAGANQLLIAVIVRPAAWHAFGLRPQQRAFMDWVTGQRDDVVLASLGVPYVLNDYPQAAVRICTYSDVPVSQQALAKYLIATH